MNVAEHIGFVIAEGRLLGDAAAAGSLDSAVPGCPEWTLRDVVGHVGTVHRWAATIVGTPMVSPAIEPAVPPNDDELVDWYAAGHAALVETLQSAPADLDCWFLFRGQPALAGWARRQALETAIHRGDAEGAVGPVTPIESALALDGIDEFLTGFGRRKKEFTSGTIRLTPGGGDPWHVTLSAEGLAATQDDPGTPSDVTVSGTASDVYRWVWNRPSDVQIEGNQAVAEQWKQIAVRWS